jgi:hypothetical protein
MHDWKELVRVRLTPLPLEPSRREEIIEELAQQIEDAYTEALAAGARNPKRCSAVSLSSRTGKSCEKMFSTP